ncbi:unnamed protein product [Lymnaea stagnalis]|uniref:HTH CENPB-type domain-containing protein n=1 Tax=Lymnaea stagnalis TaxID=6523 RepID=A0AAV2H9W0_LYMST
MKPKKKSKRSSKSKKSPEKRLSIILPPTSKRVKASSPAPPARVVKKRRLYSKEALQAAYKAVKDSSISVNAAAKQYGVPLTTLRDRVDGRISIDTTRPGPPLLMAKEEESEIAHFLQTMARYGYRYTRLELAEIATDQAVEKGKRTPRSNGLTTKWVDSFINRWPGIRELSCKYKNKSDAEHTVRTYFEEIKKIIDRYKLLEKSDRIYNIMEIQLSTYHGIASSGAGKSNYQFKTENSTNTTVIACGSVSGKVLPPFFIFQASRLRPEMQRGLPSEVSASVSENGKCSPQIFRRYLNEHFLPQAQREDDAPILVLMDGSKSHVFVGMNEWGRENNVIFSFIPAHTTHLLQPLEVECAEALQKKFESICHKYLKTSSGPCISRTCIGDLAWQAYSRVLTRHALLYSFKKAGVYPDISSDESGDEIENEHSYKGDIMKTEENSEAQDEVIFTEDLVVGHNQEVTEEEVVTTQEVVLNEDGQAEDMVMLTQNGEMIVSSNGHIVIHDGEIFVNRSEGGFSHFQPIQLIQTVDGVDQPSPSKSDSESDKSGPLKPCILTDEHLLGNTSFDESMLNSTGTGTDLNSTDNSGDQSNNEIHHMGLKLEIPSNSSDLDSSTSSESEDSPVGMNIVVKREVMSDN